MTDLEFLFVIFSGLWLLYSILKFVVLFIAEWRDRI